MLDGAARLKDMVNKAAQDGQPAIGLTDHGNMYGVFEFSKLCKAAGINPVIGEELYMVDDRKDRPKRKNKKVDDEGGEGEGGGKLYYHLTALAETQVGYKNLIQLSSRAYLEGFYYKPRVDWELLEQHHEGLIATTGCLGGMVLQAMMADKYDKGKEIAGKLLDIFGRDNLFVELQDHKIPEQTRTNPMLLKMAKEMNLHLLLANDSHYVDQCDSKAHDSLLCIQTGSQMSDPNRFKFHGDQHYFKTAAEMRHLFADYPDACDNTLWIAERANVSIADPDPKLPKFPLPDGYQTAIEYLTALTEQGATRRWGTPNKEQIERVTFELGVFENMGFSDYFLIVWDLVEYARSKGARVGPGRGSAAGSAVSYCLGITDLDPIKYDLLFERFLNPSRVSMPDVDLDIETRFREEWIRYARDKYGADRVAQIVTFSQIKSRAAARDAARVLGMDYSLGDRIAKSMPPLMMGRDTPIKACLELDPKHEEGYNRAADFRALYDGDDDAREIIDVAMGLEGLRRQDGIHAAAVVISDRPLTDILPVQRKPDKKLAPEDCPIVTQYDMHAVEDLGLLKMDFLGLRNLDVISDTLALVQQVRGIEVEIDNPPMDDPATFEMLQQAHTSGVFQLESDGMQALITRLQPTTFDDLGALVALYRPGPMDQGMHNEYADRKNLRRTVEYVHDDAREALDSTYGVMLYQEQMMRIAQKFGGYSLAEADLLRKACGKKLPELMAKEEGKFIQGCIDTGYSEELAHTWFELIRPFADYSFNRSHAYSYGFIAYQTAYLKANYSAEYMAAVLTSVSGDHEKTRPYLNECRRLGIKVLPPDINKSFADFGVVREEDDLVISYGLSSVRSVGSEWAAQVAAEREENGPFKDFFEFCMRLESGSLNKGVIAAIISAGGFDTLGHPRKGLLEIHEKAITSALKRRKKEAVGQFDLFSTAEEISEFDIVRVPIPDVEFTKEGLLATEREMLGLYVSDHPLVGAEFILGREAPDTIQKLLARGQDGEGRVGGLVTGLKNRITKAKGEAMAVFTLEDLGATVDVVVFPKTYRKFGAGLVEDKIVVMDCRVDLRDEKRQLIADNLKVIDVTERPEPFKIRMDDPAEDLLHNLKQVLLAHPGYSQVLLSTDGTDLALPDEFSVAPSNGLTAALSVLLGPWACA